MIICHNDHEPFCVSLYAIHDHIMNIEGHPIYHLHYDHEPLCVPSYAIHDQMMNIEGYPIYHPHYDHVILIIIMNNSPLCNMHGHDMKRLYEG